MTLCHTVRRMSDHAGLRLRDVEGLGCKGQVLVRVQPRSWDLAGTIAAMKSCDVAPDKLAETKQVPTMTRP